MTSVKIVWAFALFLADASAAQAAEDCQALTRLTELPAAYKLVSQSALGPAKLSIKSDGTCTCNNLPAVQRSLGQAAPEGVNWACDLAEAADSKGK